METLGYLHLACLNESPEDARSVPTYSKCSNGLNFSGVAWAKFLSIAVSVTILSITNAAMALLQEGAQGPEVGDLQSQLANQGCYSGSIDQVFGPETTQAVIECQRRLGLEADGIAGPATLSALSGGTSSEIVTPITTNDSFGEGLRLGSRGSAVSDLQNRLTAAGYYSGAIDGVFGAQTEEAVLRLQRDRGLAADGLVGTQFYQALEGTVGEPNNPPPISNDRELTIGSTGSDVEALQRRLGELRYFEGPVTGYYGSLTSEAVARFQIDRQLPQTGVADARTLNLLGVAGGTNRVNRYYVVIPKQGANTLAQVRRYFPSAVERRSRLGDYVEAGTYPSVERADLQSNLLRARGLDARVAYR